MCMCAFFSPALLPLSLFFAKVIIKFIHEFLNKVAAVFANDVVILWQIRSLRM